MTTPVATTKVTRTGLNRALNPKTIAVVGMKDGSPFVPYFERTLTHSQTEVFFVNPRHATVMGHKTFASLSDIGVPIDAVYSVTNANVATDLAEEAVSLGIGGLILVAGGFAEVGAEGEERQRRLVAAAEAGGFPVIGPNGLGMINVPEQVSLTIASDHKRRPGGVSVISQSGAVLSGIAMAAWERPAIGLNTLISAGNEAVTDLADYVDHFVDDPNTTAIGLVIEKIRRPEKFFAAARRALAAGKPIVALKLARSARTQEMAASHTGSLTGDAWVYEVAFRQLGIGLARDPEELVDRLSIIEQLDEEYWTEAANLAILTFTGGFASMAMDIAGDEGLHVPELEQLRPWVRENLPGVTVANPLDIAGQTDRWAEAVDLYGASSDIDAYLMVHPLADEDGQSGSFSINGFLDASTKYGKPFIISNCAASLGAWARELVDAAPGVASGHGARGTLRGLQTLGQFVRARAALENQPAPSAPIARATVEPISEPEGLMLPFAAGMSLLEENGIPVAPYHLIDGEDEVNVPPFDGPYVVKLADVAHRTEHGAVLVKVSAEGLNDAVTTLREIAAKDGLAPLVAVQPMVDVRGEAFLGIQNGELGPMVVFGLGGIFVEVLKRVGGRMAPINRVDAESLIAEFEDAKLMHGFRGSPAWNLDLLADLLVNAGRLASGGAGWIDSIDVNPLMVTADGFVAVDALCIVRG
ncbi:acetate--CoA ligase family protein [Microbacterium sp.]|uniref:acetate--CoA ligase family protein n=1 Tax=Microbacterium sp. TaxID=51671 RepID=UPI00273436BD|nr:acetate--CoA ligase family protein [Microbacterium sp.]MDP3950271.1 acetate--CoA ligase family protein [Microbacterium sp.]